MAFAHLRVGSGVLCVQGQQVQFKMRQRVADGRQFRPTLHVRAKAIRKVLRRFIVLAKGQTPETAPDAGRGATQDEDASLVVLDQQNRAASGRSFAR